MGWAGWMLLAAGLAAAVTLAVSGLVVFWTWQLRRAMNRRGDVPKEYDLPEPLPLPPHVKTDLSAQRRRRRQATGGG